MTEDKSVKKEIRSSLRITVRSWVRGRCEGWHLCVQLTEATLEDTVAAEKLKISEAYSIIILLLGFMKAVLQLNSVTCVDIC